MRRYAKQRDAPWGGGWRVGSPASAGLEAPARAPLARVTLAKRPVAAAGPVRVIEVDARVERRKVARAAVAGGSVWVLSRELAVEEIPLGE